LVGNKSDLEASRQVKTEEGKTLADSLGIKFLETSAKDAVNVEKAFTTLSNEIKSKVQSKPGNTGRANPSGGNSGATTLTKDPPKKDKSGCC
jgi:Ras-related protein Rab-1A